MTEIKTKIPAEMEPAAVGGMVADAKYIIDRVKNKNQTEINAETDASINQLSNEIDAVNTQDIVPVDSLPAVGSADPRKIYRVVGETSYTDNMVNAAGDGWKELAVYTFPGIDDEPTAGSDNLVKSGGVARKGNLECFLSNGTEITDSGITIKAGNITLFCDGTNIISETIASDIVFDFITENVSSYVKISKDAPHTITYGTSVTNSDLVLLWLKGNKGIVGGLLYKYYINYKNVYAVHSFAPITIEKNVVTIGVGKIYIYGYGKSKTYNHLSEETFTLYTDRQSSIVYNIDTDSISLKTVSNIQNHDIELFRYSVDGYIGGLLLGQYYDELAEKAYNRSERLLSGKLCKFKSYNKNDVVFTNCAVNEGDVIRYNVSNAHSDGETYSSTCGIGLFDASGTRLGYFGFGSATSEIKTKSGDIAIPQGFAYAAVIWGEMTVVSLYADGINDVSNGVEATKRGKLDITTTGVIFGTDRLLVNRGNTQLINYNITSEISFTWELNETCYICITKAQPYTITKETSLSSDKWVLLWHDGSTGVCGGLLYPQYIQQQIDEISGVPSFVLSQAKETYLRYIDWAGDDETIVLGFITDIHSEDNKKYQVINWLKETTKYFGYDAMVCGGDLSFEHATDEETAIELLCNFSKLSKGVLFVKGNHDFYNNTTYPDVIGNNLFSNIFVGPNKREYDIDYINNQCYGSFVMRNTLVLLLNTCGVNNDYNGYPFGFTDAQINYIISKLSSLSENQNVVIFSHIVCNPIGSWTSYPIVPADWTNGTIFNTILADFVAKRNGSSGGFNWSFANIPSSCKLVGTICGHSHFDNSVKENGINYIVRQGYGELSDISEMPSGATRVTFNWKTECNFDVFAIKPSLGEMKVFRIGAGGSSRDLEFTF